MLEINRDLCMALIIFGSLLYTSAENTIEGIQTTFHSVSNPIYTLDISNPNAGRISEQLSNLDGILSDLNELLSKYNVKQLQESSKYNKKTIEDELKNEPSRENKVNQMGEKVVMITRYLVDRGFEQKILDILGEIKSDLNETSCKRIDASTGSYKHFIEVSSNRTLEMDNKVLDSYKEIIALMKRIEDQLINFDMKQMNANFENKILNNFEIMKSVLNESGCRQNEGFTVTDKDFLKNLSNQTIDTLKYAIETAINAGKNRTEVENKVSPAIQSKLGDWVPATQKNLHPQAVKGGYESLLFDKNRLLVARAWHQGNLIPGKLIPGKTECYVAWGGLEHLHTDCEILTTPGVRWLPMKSGDKIPANAVRGGQTTKREPLFIGRAIHEGSLINGVVNPSLGYCTVPYFILSHDYSEYELLVL